MTGQKPLRVEPMQMVQPILKGSDLDDLMCMRMQEEQPSTTTSEQSKHVSGAAVVIVLAQYSDTRSKPKNAKVHADHQSRLSLTDISEL